MGLSLAGPSGVGLGLRALRWLACVDPVTDVSGFPYRPSLDGELGRCTGAVSCGRRHLPLRVGGRYARVPCVFACAPSSWPGGAGRPPGRVLVRLTFPLAALSFCFAQAPPGWGCAFLVPLFAFFLSSFFFRCSLCAPPLSLAFPGFRPRVPWALALSVSLPSPLLSLFFFCAPVVFCFLWFPAPGALGLGAVSSCPPFPLSPSRPPLLFFSLAFCAFPPLLLFVLLVSPARFSVCSRCFCVSRLTVGSSLVVTVPPPPPPRALLCLAGSVAAARCSVSFSRCSLCAPPLSLAFSGSWPRVPWALALSVLPPPPLLPFFFLF